MWRRAIAYEENVAHTEYPLTSCVPCAIQHHSMQCWVRRTPPSRPRKSMPAKALSTRRRRFARRAACLHNDHDCAIGQPNTGTGTPLTSNDGKLTMK